MTINCKGRLIDFDFPKIMGVLNVTPDSFYDGGKYKNDRKLLAQTEKMLTEGATFIDLGGYSSRPGAESVPEEEELKRVLPALELLLKAFPNSLISVDTFRSKVAKEAVDIGAAMINDISAGSLDQKMLPTVAELKVPYCMMHMQGNPQTMKNCNQYDNLLLDILAYFSKKIQAAKKLGISDLIIDPGFGFSKNPQQSFELLDKLELFKNLDHVLLVGVSRKSMIYKTLKTNPENALNGTSALNAIALYKGASILRVHDVKPALECAKLIHRLKGN